MSVLYMFVSVFAAQLSFMLSAMSMTWPSPILVKLNETDDNPLGYVISKTENSFLASISILGAILGSIAFGILCSKFGRKTLLLVAGFFPFIFYMVMAFSKVIWLLFVSRFFIGIGLGGTFTVLPMYCGEIADASHRGILSASMTVFVNIGMLIPYTLGPFIPYIWFHLVLAALSALYIVSFFIISPESPYYLIKTDEDTAREVMLKIRDEKEVDNLMKEMKENLQHVSDVSIMDILKSKGLRKTFIIGIGGFTFMQLTGTAIVATYSQTIFKEAKTDMPSEVGPILVAVAQLIMTVFVSAITDKFPRKFLLSLSHLLIALVQIPFGTYFYLQKHNHDVTSINWLPLVCLIIYVCVYNIGVGPILMTFLGELFPPKVKGLAISCMVSYNWIGTFLLTTLFNTLNDTIGIGLLFWIFSCANFLAVIFIRFFMVETKGKTLEQIQKELNY